jgi:flagellar assembly factor FliW
VIIETGRFGPLTIDSEEVINVPQGILGFPDLKKYCLVDPGEETLILWLQSVEKPEICFPVLEPNVFKPDYTVRLSGADLRELKLESVTQSAVFTILTIPNDVNMMTANLKAPLVINLGEKTAKQVVLQENEYTIKHEMFKELRAHLMTIQSIRKQTEAADPASPDSKKAPTNVLCVRDFPVSAAVKAI